MMTRDPNDVPEIDMEALEEGKKRRLVPVGVLCDEPNAKVDDEGGVLFIAFVSFIPRIGDTIKLENGTSCRVKAVKYKLVRDPEVPKLLTLMPTVHAIRYQ